MHEIFALADLIYARNLIIGACNAFFFFLWINIANIYIKSNLRCYIHERNTVTSSANQVIKN